MHKQTPLNVELQWDMHETNRDCTTHVLDEHYMKAPGS
jgi:hypothetical protein